MKLTQAEEKKVVEFYFSNGKSPTTAMRVFNCWAHNNHYDTIVTKKT
jgi:hypothetical protein